MGCSGRDPVKDVRNKFRAPRFTNTKLTHTPKISSEALLVDATRIFAETGMHRLLMVNANKKVIGVLSPSAVTRFAILHLKGLVDSALNHSVEELNLGSAPVISVPKHCSFMEALKLMVKSKHSCVAVVDDRTKVLAGSVSMSDIKLIFSAKDVTLLSMSCWDFIVFSRSLLDSEQFPFFGVGPESKIISLCSKLLATSVHHVYVVDATQKPKKIIGFSDVIKVLAG